MADPLYNPDYLNSGGPAPACLDSGDDNDSGGITLADPQYSLNFQFSAGPPPPAPYPNCGTDPTLDSLSCLSSPCGRQNVRPRHGGGTGSAPAGAVALSVSLGESEDTVYVGLDLDNEVSCQAFETAIGYDPGSLTFLDLHKTGFEGEQMDFCSAKAFADSGTIHVGAVMDYDLIDVLPPGHHHIGEFRFLNRPTGQQAESPLLVRRGVLVDSELRETPMKAGQEIRVGLPQQEAIEPAVSFGISNPYRPGTAFALEMKAAAEATVQIYDVQGRLGRTLFRGEARASALNLSWDGRTDSGHPARSGLYWLRARLGQVEEKHRIVLLP